MTYEEVLSRLFSERDEGYREFHKKLLKNDKIEVIGVRMPVLRRLARMWKGRRNASSLSPTSITR